MAVVVPALASTVVATGVAAAADLVVTRTDDPPPDGCEPGDCSLREAIIAANGTPATETIALGPGTYVLAIPPSGSADEEHGDLDVTGSLVLTGVGAGVTVIDARGVDRAIEVGAGVEASLSRLTLTNGAAATPEPDGSAAKGGALRNAGGTSLTDVTVTASRSGPSVQSGDRVLPSGDGGGIANLGELVLTRVTVQGNSIPKAGQATGQSGPAPGGSGGGIWNAGSLTMSDSVVEGNTAGDGGDGTPFRQIFGSGAAGGAGGGLANTGTAVVVRTRFAGNEAGDGGRAGLRDGTDPVGAGGRGGSGGAVVNTGGTLEVLSSTFTGNAAGEPGTGTPPPTPGDGGAIFVAGGRVDVDRSALWANAAGGEVAASAAADRTGGVLVAAGATAELDNVTVSGHAPQRGVTNRGFLGVRASTLTGNGAFTATGDTALATSILDDAFELSPLGFTSGGWNVVTAPGFPGGASDASPASPRLGALLGGDPVPTHPLGDGSTALDFVDTRSCLPTDARGVVRPQGAACDAGAHERRVADTVGLVDPGAGRWYLRDGAAALTSFFYGNPGDRPVIGDWDADGTATPGLFRESDGFFYSRDSNSQGIADATCFAGNPGDVPLAGDWDGDGDDNLGIYRPSEQRFYLFTVTCDGTGLGTAQLAFAFGNSGDVPVAGDWDGDGADEVGLHRPSTGFFYWRNSPTTGIADGEMFFGDPADRFVAGDWGIVDGVDTPAVFRPSDVTFYLRHTLSQGNADSQFAWPGAGAGWLPVAGRFGLG